jgi:hypothetical protein
MVSGFQSAASPLVTEKRREKAKIALRLLRFDASKNFFRSRTGGRESGSVVESLLSSAAIPADWDTPDEGVVRSAVADGGGRIT